MAVSNFSNEFVSAISINRCRISFEKVNEIHHIIGQYPLDQIGVAPSSASSSRGLTLIPIKKRRSSELRRRYLKENDDVDPPPPPGSWLSSLNMSPGIAASSRLPNHSPKSSNSEMPPPLKPVEQITITSVVDESYIPSSIGICTPPPATLLEVSGNKGTSVRGSSMVGDSSIPSSIQGRNGIMLHFQQNFDRVTS